MGKAERQGQHQWDRYLKAGIVDTHLKWSDDAIVVAHALGKTQEAVGKCWPMDAAVAYTLASAGPDANLTSKDMVNQYTKIAAAMMSQTVGYSDHDVPDSRVDSCGHDEISGMMVEFNEVMLDGRGHLCFLKNSRMLSCEDNDTASKEIKSLMSFRIDDTVRFDNDISGAMSIMGSPKFKPLRTYIETKFGTTKWAMDGGRPFNITHTLGVCKWEDSLNADESKKLCAYHDEPKYEGWVLIKKLDEEGNILDNRFERIWNRGKHSSVHSGWNRRHGLGRMSMHTNLRKITANRVVIWNRVMRGLSNTIPDKLVIKEINAACRRMTARNFNVVRKEGLRNKATYTWKEWNWLANLTAWIAQTRQKNRKEHDLVNGWKWTKFNSRVSYGYEIAQFKWIPGEVNTSYDENTDRSVRQDGDRTFVEYSTPPAVKQKMNVWRMKYGTSYYGSEKAPWVWRSKALVMQFVDFLPLMAGKTGAVGTRNSREWDASKGAEIIPVANNVKIISEDLSEYLILSMDKDPEDLPSPTELLEALQWGSPQEFDAAFDILAGEAQHYWERPTISNIPEENGDGGATSVIQ